MRAGLHATCLELTLTKSWIDAVAKEDSAATSDYAGTSRPAGRRLTSGVTAGDDFNDEERYGDDDV